MKFKFHQPVSFKQCHMTTIASDLNWVKYLLTYSLSFAIWWYQICIKKVLPSFVKFTFGHFKVNSIGGCTFQKIKLKHPILHFFFLNRTLTQNEIFVIALLMSDDKLSSRYNTYYVFQSTLSYVWKWKLNMYFHCCIENILEK